MLVNNATSNASAAAGPTIVAPYQVEAFGNFAIETRVRKLNGERGFDAMLFHGNSTASGWQGYKVTITQNARSITSTLRLK